VWFNHKSLKQTFVKHNSYCMLAHVVISHSQIFKLTSVCGASGIYSILSLIKAKSMGKFRLPIHYKATMSQISDLLKMFISRSNFTLPFLNSVCTFVSKTAIIFSFAWRTDSGRPATLIWGSVKKQVFIPCSFEKITFISMENWQIIIIISPAFSFLEIIWSW